MTTEPLLPAEAALLIDPKRSSAGKCLQAALLTLLSKNHIAIEEEGGWIKKRYLRLLPAEVGALPRHLATVKNSLSVYAIGGRLKSDRAAQALQKSFGNDFRKYVHDVLAPLLISRGLLRKEQRRFLGLIPYVVYERTMSGEAKARPLIALLDEAGRMKKLLPHDPDRAIRIAMAAGVLLVLSPEARAQVPKLKAMLQGRESSDTAGLVGVGGGDDEQSTGWELGVDVGTFDFSADVGGVLDSIGSISDFTGGDGGGDGGDGGGGD